MSDTPERFSVPLYMLGGNLEALLKANDEGRMIACNGISLRRYSVNSEQTVILVVSMNEDQKKFAKEHGFQTQSVKEDE